MARWKPMKTVIEAMGFALARKICAYRIVQNARYKTRTMLARRQEASSMAPTALRYISGGGFPFNQTDPGKLDM